MTDHAIAGVQSTSIYDHFRGLIITGRLGGGERLPTVRQTARDLGVSAGTAARAYKQLEHEGLVVTRTGAGTKVAPQASPLPEHIVDLIRELARTTARHGASSGSVMSAIRAELEATQADYD